MKKFPVRSGSTGKAYKVKVRDEEYPWGKWRFVLYEPKKWRGILYFRKVTSRSVEKCEFDGGFVREAELLVREYEDDVQREESRRYHEDFGRREFSEWDGVVR